MSITYDKAYGPSSNPTFEFMNYNDHSPLNNAYVPNDHNVFDGSVYTTTNDSPFIPNLVGAVGYQPDIQPPNPQLPNPQQPPPTQGNVMLPIPRNNGPIMFAPPVQYEPTTDDHSTDDNSNEESEEDKTANAKQNATIPMFLLFGEQVDKDSAIVIYMIIFLWIVLWRVSNLYKTLKYDRIFSIIFFSFIFYMLMNITTSGTTSGGVIYELNILLTVEQMISILLGTVILFTLFEHKLPIHESCRGIIKRIMFLIIIILTLSSLWVNVITTGRAFRAIRKFKQGVYNIALILFMIVCLLFIKGNQCV